LQKAYCKPCTYNIEIFTSVFGGKFLEQVVGFDPKLGISIKTSFQNLPNQLKQTFYLPA